MKVQSTRNKTKSEPSNNVNAIPADEAGANPKDVLTKAEYEELQNCYLMQAQLEHDIYLYQEELGKEGLMSAINEVKDEDDRQALIDYCEHRPDSFNETSPKINSVKEIAEWCGTSQQRIGQINDKALRKLRNNPKVKAMFTDNGCLDLTFIESEEQ